MSSRWKYVAGTLALLVMTYSLVISGELLLGAMAATFLYGIVWVVATFRPDEGYIGVLGWPRIAVLALIGTALLTYSLVILNQILLGVLAACFVALVGFLSAPGGPITRIVEFYRAVLRIDRHLREAEGGLTDGGREDGASTGDESADEVDDDTGWERERDD